MLATRTIGVRLNADELAALRAIAGREDRDPRRQAARLVREGLIREGALTQLETATGVAPASAVPA